MSFELVMATREWLLCGNLQNCSLERSACQTFKPKKISTSLDLATQQASLTYTSLIQTRVTGLKPDKQFRICEKNQQNSDETAGFVSMESIRLPWRGNLNVTKILSKVRSWAYYVLSKVLVTAVTLFFCLGGSHPSLKVR